MKRERGAGELTNNARHPAHFSLLLCLKVSWRTRMMAIFFGLLVVPVSSRPVSSRLFSNPRLQGSDASQPKQVNARARKWQAGRQAGRHVREKAIRKIHKHAAASLFSKASNTNRTLQRHQQGTERFKILRGGGFLFSPPTGRRRREGGSSPSPRSAAGRAGLRSGSAPAAAARGVGCVL